MSELRAPVDAWLGNDWIRPHWMERQLDPRSPAFVPNRSGSSLANLTLRNWTVIGTVGSAFKGIVDPRGLVTPGRTGWSLDWWILGEDRWHFPSREAAVRQQLVDDTPVVETSMRIKGGDAVQRVYAVSAPGPMAIMEITNRTPTPIAVALSVRPYNPVGLATVGRVELHDRTVVVDGRPALLFPKRPQGAAVSTFRGGDVALQVVAEATGGAFPDDVRCDSGQASAAFVFPLAHTASLRVAMPLDAQDRRDRRRFARRRAEPGLVLPEVVPAGDAVARGWQAQTDGRGLRLVLPEGTMASTIEANRRSLLLFHEGSDLVSGPFASSGFDLPADASLLGALGRFGFQAESAEVIRNLPGRQRTDGSFSGRQDADPAEGAALHAMAEHWRLSGSLEDVDAVAVARGARSIGRKRVPGDEFWSLRGLLDAADLLRVVEDERAAVECEAWAAARRSDLEASMALLAQRLDRAELVAGPATIGIDTTVLTPWIDGARLGLFPPDHPALATILDAIRRRATIGPAVFQAAGFTGLAPSTTMQLAAVELATGDSRAMERLAWMLELASETSTWPDFIHPTLGRGCNGDGHSGSAAAEFLSFARNLLVRESATNELALCTMLPESWRGQNLEVHNAPTHFGDVSFAVRWHDERPALLWDRTAREGAPPVRLTAPGLDASWSSESPKGEALLAAAPGARVRDEVPSGIANPIEGSFN